MNQVQNILIGIGSLRAGGTEKHVYQLLKNMDRQKFNIHLWLLEGYTDCNFGDGRIPENTTIVVTPRQLLPCTLYLNKYIKEHHIVLTYSTCVETNTPLSLCRLLNKKFKFIISRRGIYLTHTMKWKMALRFSEWLADGIITNSKTIFEHIPVKWHSKLKLIHNPVETTTEFYNKEKAQKELTIPEGKIVLGNIGRFSYEKGQDILLRAFARVKEEINELYLVLIGVGETETVLKEIIKDLQLEKDVMLAGSLPNASRFVKAFDVFVLPSRTDTFPNALLEAMSAGVPSVACNTGGATEIISEKRYGFLCGANENAIAETLLLALTNKDHCIEIANNTPEYISTNFKLENNIRAFENQFENYLCAE